MSGTAESPVSWKVATARLPAKGVAIWFEATAEQRDALAAAHGLVAVGAFRVDATVRPWRSDGVAVSGRVEADIVQTCVVSLEELPAHIDAEISALFVPEGSRLSKPAPGAASEVVLDPDGPDAPETFAGDTIDAGALAEEFFALAIDPYPRKPGLAALDAGGGSDEPASSGAGAFEELRMWRGRR